MIFGQLRITNFSRRSYMFLGYVCLLLVRRYFNGYKWTERSAMHIPSSNTLKVRSRCVFVGDVTYPSLWSILPHRPFRSTRTSHLISFPW